VPVDESTAFTVKLKLPAAVGVPERTPDVLSVMPAGNAPAVMLYVYADVPLLAVSVCEYAVAIVPAVSVDGVIAMLGAVVTKLYSCVPLYGPVPAVESVALIVKLKDPPAVGVPDSRPAVVSVRPAGNAPAEMVKLYGDVPPDAVTVCEYAEPTVGAGSVVCVTVTVAAPTESVYACVPLNGAPVPVLESTAFTVKPKLPAVVGVPVIAPVALFSARPAGSAPAEMEYVYGDVPPEAVADCAYATPAVAAVSTDGEMLTVGAFTANVYGRAPVNGAPVPVDESVAVTVKLKLPAAVGVPDSRPAVDSVTPAGSVPDVIAYV